MTLDMTVVGAFAFGVLIGWYVYYVNRYRKGDVQFSDITTLIGVIGGGSLLKLFDQPGAVPLSASLFGWYGTGLAVGFFGYFLVLFALVKQSKDFTMEWFLDGRRPNPPPGWGYGQDAASTIHPMGGQVPLADKEPAAPVQIYLAPGLVPAATGDWWVIRSSPRAGTERVAEARRLLAEGRVYPRGCSEFVCAVLGIPYQLANDLMGDSPTSVGGRPPYPNLQPGDIAGWVNLAGSGHVAVYIGESDAAAFIDVREPGAKPRSKNGFYDRELFKSSAH